ncbi:hypothetical protein RND71_010593 [Anisodus tanguticus]|uniref:Uncharacterized protein n=1 Tax=Anisodus tanguticus TaxID=243964 RepID=A0AAE1SKL8_9SOLA|nr:hypothetical protein RND71_010593 [Anisodus tanguticus]
MVVSSILHCKTPEINVKNPRTIICFTFIALCQLWERLGIDISFRSGRFLGIFKPSRLSVPETLTLHTTPNYHETTNQTPFPFFPSATIITTALARSSSSGELCSHHPHHQRPTPLTPLVLYIFNHHITAPANLKQPATTPIPQARPPPKPLLRRQSRRKRFFASRYQIGDHEILISGDDLEIADYSRLDTSGARKVRSTEINEEDDENYNEILTEGSGSNVDQFDQQIPIPTEEPHEIIKQLEQRVRVNSDELEFNSPDVKKLRENLLDDDLIDDSKFSATCHDFDSFMKSFEEEITPATAMEVVDLTEDSDVSRPELGYLLETSDDELGLPPPSTATSVESELVRVNSDSTEMGTQ